MEVSLLDVAANNAEKTLKLIDFAPRCNARLKDYDVKTVKDFYAFDSLSGWEVTPAQALLINLGDKKARDDFYLNKANFRHFRGILGAYCLFEQRTMYYEKRAALLLDDFMQQVYVDLPFYNFTTERKLTKSLIYTAKTLEYGGISALKEFYRVVKISNTISLYHENRIGEDGELCYLIDTLSVGEEYNPEAAAIRSEENAAEKADKAYYDIERLIKQNMLKGFKGRKLAELLGALL